MPQYITNYLATYYYVHAYNSTKIETLQNESLPHLHLKKQLSAIIT